MAEEDVHLRGYVRLTFYSAVTLIAVSFVFKKQIKQLRLQLVAWFLAKVGKKSNLILGEQKADLFHSLEKLKLTLGRELKILEIGAGGGINFKFYPSGTKVTCLDPNPCFESYIDKNASDTDKVEVTNFVNAFAENMGEIDDCSYDVVVSTLVLCTVRDPQQVLREVKRVLKHNGKYYFMDHVSAEKNTILYHIQRLLNPIWRQIADGCELTRDTGATIKAAGFKSLDMKYFKAPTRVLVIKPSCMGIATK